MSKLWLGNLPAGVREQQAMDQLEFDNGLPRPRRVCIRSSTGTSKVQFCIAEWSSQAEADHVRQHGITWSSGKHAVIRCLRRRMACAYVSSSLLFIYFWPFANTLNEYKRHLKL